MRHRTITKRWTLCFAGLAILLSAGCNEESSPTDNPPVVESGQQEDHGGWWCAEHGLPEEDCSMCSSEAAARFKEQDDWCEEHNRAKSQCFKCDPALAEKFAKLYEAKYGEEPPPITE
jgi:hypothetical protein